MKRRPESATDTSGRAGRAAGGFYLGSITAGSGRDLQDRAAQQQLYGALLATQKVSKQPEDHAPTQTQSLPPTVDRPASRQRTLDGTLPVRRVS